MTIEELAILESNLIVKAERLISSAEQKGLPLRLLGGLAVRITSPHGSTHYLLRRSYADIDLVGLSRDVRRIKDIFLEQGYVSDTRFNALHGETRLIFYDPANDKHIDVFLDQFNMCHKIDLRKRLLPGYKTLTLADLLVTKLQIVQLNTKDMMDIYALILDHEVAVEENSESIDGTYIAGLAGKNWGLFTTLSDNLHRVQEEWAGFLEEAEASIVRDRADRLLNWMEAAEKSMAWKIRARIGRRMKWYDLPDEVAR